MGSFTHNEQGQIIIVDNSGNHGVYEAVWWIANEEKAYELPVDATSQYYRQDDTHAWHTPTEAVIGSIPWVEGDGYISNKATYDANWQTYLDSLKDLQQVKDEVKAESIAYNESVKLGMVQISATNYPSDYNTFIRLSREFEKYYRDTATPAGYYVYDAARNQVTKNLTELAALVDLTVDFLYDCDIEQDIHQDAIQALATKELAWAYDYTASYPTTPYTGV